MSTRVGVGVGVGVAVLAALLAGCGSGERAPAPPAPTGTATAAAPAERPALEGTWETAPISVEQTEATLRRHGLGRWVADYRRNAPFTDDTVLTLTIEGGAWNLYGSSDGGAPEPIDYDAEYDIDGSSVVFHHSDGSNTHRWTVDGDTLRLRFVSSTLPAYRGIPDEVFQRALYMTSTFVRRG